jgi:hypothetical protein
VTDAPIHDALVKNADTVTSDVHLACRAARLASAAHLVEVQARLNAAMEVVRHHAAADPDCKLCAQLGEGG